MTKEERKLYMNVYRKTNKWKLSKEKSDKKYYQKNIPIFLYYKSIYKKRTY
jgi:hypothetical protein